MTRCCEYCGSALPEGATVCPTCNAKVPLVEAATPVAEAPAQQVTASPVTPAQPTQPAPQPRPDQQMPTQATPTQQMPTQPRPAPSAPQPRPAQPAPQQRPASQPGPQPRPASQPAPQQRPASQPGPQQRPAQPAPQQRPAAQPGPQTRPAQPGPQQRPVPGAAQPGPQQRPVPGAAPQAPQPASPKRGINPKLIAAIAGGVAVLILAVVLITRFAGKGGAGAATRQPITAATVSPDDSWTILCYFCGSNLETDSGLATHNINELLSVDLPDNVRFVFECGGAHAWQNDVVPDGTLGRYEVRDQQLVPVQQLELASMAEEQTLADFAAWGVQTYPADHYVMLFWDHGGGSLVGVCSDEMGSGTLELPEIAGGLAAAGVTFDMVGFDTCLMATLETAQVLAPYARAMVASEETEPGRGWDWAALGTWLTHPADNVADFGRAICESYYAKCERTGVERACTLSCVDLTLMDELTAALADATTTMADCTDDPRQLQPLLAESRSVQSFYHASYLEGYSNMVDLGDLMTCMDGPLGTTDDAVREVLSRMITSEVHGDSVDRATGLSIFYPLKMDFETFQKYFQLSLDCKFDNIPYLQFLAARTGVYDQVDWQGLGIADLDPLEATDATGQMTYSASINAEGRYQVDIPSGGEWLSYAYMTVGMMLPDASIARLGSDVDLGLEIDPSDGSVHYTDHFGGVWLKVGGAYIYATIVDMVADADGPDHLLYSTPVEWTFTLDNGETRTLDDVNLLTRYDYATRELSVVCVYRDADDNGMSGKATSQLSEGDQLRFLVTRTMPDGTTDQGSTGTITWTHDTEMSVGYPGDAVYLYYITLVDLFGNEYTCDPAVFQYTAGERTLSTMYDPSLVIEVPDNGGGTEGGGTEGGGTDVTTADGMQLIGNDLVGGIQVPANWEDRTGDYPVELSDRYGFRFFVDPSSSYSSSAFGTTGYATSVRVRAFEQSYQIAAEDLVTSYQDAGVYEDIETQETTFNGIPCVMVTGSIPADGLRFCDIVAERGDGQTSVLVDVQGTAETFETVLSYLATWQLYT